MRRRWLRWVQYALAVDLAFALAVLVIGLVMR
jgi:hypothetical protein